MTKDIQTTVETLENKMIEIKGEISAEVFEHYRERAVSRIGAEIEVDGFRKGKAPLHVIEKKVGDESILREMAEMAIAEHYPAMLETHKLDAIGQPLVSLTKLAKGNPLGFSIRTVVMPEIVLPDYKVIAKEIKKEAETPVTDEEVSASILQARKAQAHQELHDKGIDHDQHNPEHMEEKDLPALTDETAGNFGPFKTVKALEVAVREHIEEQKKQQSKEKHRIAIVEKILDATKTELPDMLIQIETENMLSRLRHDLEQFGSTMDQYLKTIGKGEVELRAEWKKEAERRALLQLLLEKLAQVEKIEADKEEVEAELKKVIEAYPTTNELRARHYIETTMRNERVFQFLETLS